MAVTGAGIGVYRITSNNTISGRIFVKTVRWVGGTTAGHNATLSSGGLRFFEGEADGANFTDLQPVYTMFDGIAAGTLDSGTLYVYTG